MNTILLESTEHGDVPVDVYHKLANDRIIFIHDIITDSLATDVVATLLLKDSEDPTKKITMFINSQGGDIRNVLMICDMMTLIESPIETVCIGAATDEAALILTSGTKGLRFATKNAIITAGQLMHDHAIPTNLTEAKKLLDLFMADNKRMMDIFAKTTGKSIKQVSEDLDRRVFMNSSQAVRYGLIDKVVTFNK